jgi:hypothetical protein
MTTILLILLAIVLVITILCCSFKVARKLFVLVLKLIIRVVTLPLQFLIKLLFRKKERENDEKENQEIG